MTLVEPINLDGGIIPAIATAFFTGLFGFLTYIARESFKTRRALQSAKKVAESTKDVADATKTAVDATKKHSGDFTHRTDNNMRIIIDAVYDVQQQLQDHLAWHVWNTERGHQSNDSQRRKSGQQQEHRGTHRRNPGKDSGSGEP